ncbi:MAG: hypothetical protein ACWGMZ_01690 [Thermoguttaceae bacterium]
MGKKSIFWLIVFAMVLATSQVDTVLAVPPWLGFVSLKHVEADPDKQYALSESNGPWMIMACSFSGEGAKKQAKELVYELRKRYKLPAYTHELRINLKDIKGRGLDRFGDPVKMRYRKGSKIDEVAVVVGDYPAVNDPEAQKILAKIKVAKPDCLDVKEGKPTNQTLAYWRTTLKAAQTLLGDENKELGPMSHAFITTNPLLPQEFFKHKGLDKLVLDMNRNVPHSLLDCPGKYSVQVATFKGEVIIKQNEIRDIENGRKQLKSHLDEAAMKAHTLTEALRMKGYEAYEFHDRNASIVTVGSFNSVGMPRTDGRIEINPKIHAIMKTFGAQPVNVPGKKTPITPLKSLAGINFDIQSIPILVPKRSISVTLNRHGQKN